MKKLYLLLAVIVLAGIGTSFMFVDNEQSEAMTTTTIEYITTTTTQPTTTTTVVPTTTTTVPPTTTTVYIPPTTTTTTAPPVQPTVATGSVWDSLAQCESGGNWSYPPVSGGFSGGIMFHITTWQNMGGTAYAPDAYLATREQQIEIAEKVLAVQGWGAWPGCSAKLGLR